MSRDRPRRIASRLTSFALILGASLVAVNGWLAGGALQSIARDGAQPEYVLVSPPWSRLLAWLAAAVLLTIGLGQPQLRALRWLALSILPLFVLFAPASGAFAPFLYVLHDLRWYWWAVVAFDVGASLVREAGAPSKPHRWAWAGIALSVPLVFSVAFTPHLRFSGVLHGDEPKYLRFCETLFQGHGFDISRKRPLTVEDAPPMRLGANVGHVLAAVPEELALMATDVRRMLTGAGPARLRAGEPSPSMFFRGKHPGTIYQLHNPGLSFVLLPAYLLDRTVTGSGIGYQDEFPESMPALHVALLAMFAAYAFVLFRLLAITSRPRDAALVTVLAASTLPTAAFAFQIYPEVAAGIVLGLLTTMLLHATSASRRALFGIGVLAGSLPWLHVRFLLTTVWVLLAHLASRRAAWRREAWLLAGAAVPLALLMFYAYRLTGSLLPTTTYGSEAPLSLTRMLLGVPAFALDREWGLLPHSPIYLIALPGLGLLLRRQPWTAAFLVVTTLTVVVPAAGHGYWAGGSTPGRYLVSIVPLLGVFMAAAIREWGRARLFQAAFVALALVSVETAVRYDLHHVKEFGPLVARGLSGWRMNLLFPSIGTNDTIPPAVELGLGALWVGIAMSLVLAGWRTGRSPRRGAAGSWRDALWWRGPAAPAGGLRLGAAAALILLALLGYAAAPLNGLFDRQHMVPAKEARERALEAYAAMRRCAICYSSRSGAVPPTEALGNDLGAVNLSSEWLPATTAGPVRIRVRPRSTSGEYVISTVRVDFGDGTAVSHSRLYGDVDERHVYRQPGEYVVHAWVRTGTDAPVESQLALAVAAPRSP
ncbi:MAG: hypothetical protein AB7Q29_15560 [Vicinamibacterales bacterium]